MLITRFLQVKFRAVMRIVANKFLAIFNLVVIDKKTYASLLQFGKFYWGDPFMLLFKSPAKVRELIPLSKSGVRQDLFVISELDFKKDGFFVEIGAFDGITSSNTYMLEKEFSWTGILSEPSRSHAKTLSRLRSCRIDLRAVYSESKIRLKFEDLGGTQLSTLSEFLEGGIQEGNRLGQENRSSYLIETVSLNDLLVELEAPNFIDYISIDTEGSEYEILKTFDFNKFDVQIFTIEHNYDEIARAKILDLMISNGYHRVYPQVSHQDDWFRK